MRAMRLISVPIVVVGLCAGCGGGKSSPPTPPAPNTVTVANFAFSPATITVQLGDTVTWVFHQAEAPHNVVSLNAPVSFNSGVPQGAGTFKFTFTQVGTYTYDCQVHPNMLGKVVVVAAGTAGASATTLGP